MLTRLKLTSWNEVQLGVGSNPYLFRCLTVVRQLEKSFEAGCMQLPGKVTKKNHQKTVVRRETQWSTIIEGREKQKYYKLELVRLQAAVLYSQTPKIVNNHVMVDIPKIAKYHVRHRKTFRHQLDIQIIKHKYMMNFKYLIQYFKIFIVDG